MIQRVKPGDAGEKLVMRISTVYWKSDDRLLVRVSVQPDRDVRLTESLVSKLLQVGSRVFAVNRDGTKVTALLADNHESAFAGAYDFGAIMSFLPKDPNHVLMVIAGWKGRSLYKVDLETGLRQAIEYFKDKV